MEALKSILDNFFRKPKLKSVVDSRRVLAVWDSAVGTLVARHAQPKKLQDHTLWVEVDNSTWMQQMHFMEEKIKTKLNLIMGANTVEKIRFKLGLLYRHPSHDAPQPSVPGWCALDLNEDVRKNIEQEIL
ncbi:MAG: DUF721 domain-containing protein, partial [Deltaproteobacteria bacterium]|nr:DUF721 domain-containing protein [Deltaproteobacteria bacterium]